MRQRLAHTGIFLALALIVLALGGCGTVGVVIADGPPAGPPSEPGGGPEEAPGQQGRALPGGGNNRTIRLDSGVYSGGTISGNKVTMVGQGPRATVIRGDLIIRGNNCTVRNVTIQGNVVITANNADLTGARVEGVVDSRGQNNVW